MDKATPTPASVESVMAKAMMLVGALGDSCEAATSLPFLEAVTALRAEVERLAAQAAPSSAIIASLCGDVEPVALAVVHEKEPLELFCSSSYVDFLPGEYNLYPASAVAALAAERDALLTALEDLTSEAVEIWEYPADYPQIEHANELIAKHKAALTKGQPAPQPQQEQSK